MTLKSEGFLQHVGIRGKKSWKPVFSPFPTLCLYPHKTNVFGVIPKSAGLSVCRSVYKVLIYVEAGVLSHI